MSDLWLQPVHDASLRWAHDHARELDDHEVQRWNRYLKHDDRDLFLVAHIATRHVLSRYSDQDPASWEFSIGERGRPEITNGPAGMRFNISHTLGMVAVLVHDETDCGVDVENIRRPTDIDRVSKRVFTETEQAWVFSGPTDVQADRFYQLWTLKESFIKAKGRGFALPLKQFSFEIHVLDADSERIEFDCDPTIDPEPEKWCFNSLRIKSGHIVSMANQSVATSPVAPQRQMPVVTRTLGLDD